MRLHRPVDQQPQPGDAQGPFGRRPPARLLRHARGEDARHRGHRRHLQRGLDGEQPRHRDGRPPEPAAHLRHAARRAGVALLDHEGTGKTNTLLLAVL